MLGWRIYSFTRIKELLQDTAVCAPPRYNQVFYPATEKSCRGNSAYHSKLQWWEKQEEAEQDECVRNWNFNTIILSSLLSLCPLILNPQLLSVLLHIQSVLCSHLKTDGNWQVIKTGSGSQFFFVCQAALRASPSTIFVSHWQGSGRQLSKEGFFLAPQFESYRLKNCTLQEKREAVF